MKRREPLPIRPGETPERYSARANSLILQRLKQSVKKCVDCGSEWKPEFLSDEMQCRCRPCRARKLRADKDRRKIKKPAMNKCRTCLKPTGDPRATVRYCPEHDWKAKWLRVHQQEVIKSIKVPTEDEICLQIAKECLTKARNHLNSASRESPPSPREESTRPSTSQP